MSIYDECRGIANPGSRGSGISSGGGLVPSGGGYGAVPGGMYGTGGAYNPPGEGGYTEGGDGGFFFSSAPSSPSYQTSIILSTLVILTFHFVTNHYLYLGL